MYIYKYIFITVCHLAHCLVALAPPLVKMLIFWAGDNIFIFMYLYIYVCLYIYIYIYSSHICHLAHGLVALAPPLVKMLILWAGDKYKYVYVYVYVYIFIYIHHGMSPRPWSRSAGPTTRQNAHTLGWR